MKGVDLDLSFTFIEVKLVGLEKKTLVFSTIAWTLEALASLVESPVVSVLSFIERHWMKTFPVLIH